MNEAEAWRCFNTGDNNQDPGGSWLYAIRYSEENLLEHQESVISAIQVMGVTMHQLPDGSLFLSSENDLSEEELQRVMILSEELTVTNEALEHSKIDLYGSSVTELTDMYKVAFLSSISIGNTEAAGGILRSEMPQLISDLSRAQTDNEPLSEKDYEAVLELADFVADKTALLISGGAVVTMSNFGPTRSLAFDDLPDTY